MIIFEIKVDICLIIIVLNPFEERINIFHYVIGLLNVGSVSRLHRPRYITKWQRLENSISMRDFFLSPSNHDVANFKTGLLKPERHKTVRLWVAGHKNMLTIQSKWINLEYAIMNHKVYLIGYIEDRKMLFVVQRIVDLTILVFRIINWHKTYCDKCSCINTLPLASLLNPDHFLGHLTHSGDLLQLFFVCRCA